PPAARGRCVEGLRGSASAEGEALARVALTAVRKIARDAGKPLPARVAPASYVATIPSRDRGGLGIWIPIVLAFALFAFAWLGYELRTSRLSKTATSLRP